VNILPFDVSLLFEQLNMVWLEHGSLNIISIIVHVVGVINLAFNNFGYL